MITKHSIVQNLKFLFAPTKNIGMPDSLLSRFDLVFIILDEKSAEKDKKIAERVTRNHRLAPRIN